MRLILDADAIIKLHRAGILDLVVKHHECRVPQAVFDEVVSEGRAKLHPDAEPIERSLAAATVVNVGATESVRRLGAGETQVLLLALDDPSAVAVSDDRQFLAALVSHGEAYFNPATLIVAMAQQGTMNKEQALAALDRMRRHIRPDVYQLASEALQERDGADEE